MRKIIDTTPFIKGVKHPESASLGQNITIHIYGSWPNPSWSINKIDYTENSELKSMEILITGKSKGGIAIQRIEPFELDIEIAFNTLGKWSIFVKGKSKSVESFIDILSE
ncbi:MAG: hypothetical protein INQ03_06420 [Candidatus Heimdallarchaeota archaeon]|nr:hypothetical protein [Candidatus Heimdallarchaeota archaeon]